MSTHHNKKEKRVAAPSESRGEGHYNKHHSSSRSQAAVVVPTANAPRSRNVEHYIKVDPRTNAKEFHATDARTGSQMYGYAYNSDDDPRYKRGSEGNNGIKVQQRAYYFSTSSSPPQQVQMPQQRSERHSSPVIVEVEQEEAIDAPETNRYDRHRQHHRPAVEGSASWKNHKQPIVEEPDDTEDDRSDYNDNSHKHRTKAGGSRRAAEVRPRHSAEGLVAHDTSLFPSMDRDPFEAMHTLLARTHGEMMMPFNPADDVFAFPRSPFPVLHRSDPFFLSPWGRQ